MSEVKPFLKAPVTGYPSSGGVLVLTVPVSHKDILVVESISCIANHGDSSVLELLEPSIDVLGP